MSDQANLAQQLAGTNKIWHLKQTALLDGLSAEELERISSLSHDEVFPPSVVIFEQSDPADLLYFLNRGTVRLAIKNADGREKTVAILGGGDLFGLESVGSEQAYQVQAVAHEESWVSVLSRSDYLRLSREFPTLSLNLIQILIQRLSEAHDDIKALCFMDIQQRLVTTLLKLSETHGRQLATDKNLVKLKVRISHDYLARLIGSNRPYLSNIMSQFKKQGWVRYDRNRLLINTAALQQLI